MLPVKCFTCGHILADLELEYEDKLFEYDNNFKLSDMERAKLKRELIDKLLPDRWKKRYCCRSRLISYVDLIKIVL